MALRRDAVYTGTVKLVLFWFIVVPILIENGVLFVTARVDGSRPMLFVFDPGAGSYITQYAAAQLRDADIRVLRIGSVAISEKLPVITGDPRQLDPAHDERLGQIGGTIGAELLKGFVLRIDYARSEMALIPPNDFQPPGGGGLPLQIDSFGVPAIPAAVNDVLGTFELDVRAPSTMLFTPFARSLGYRPAKTSKQIIDSVSIGGYRQTNVPVWISTATNGKFAVRSPLGLIGNDVLAAYVITLDYSGRKAYVVHRGRNIREPKPGLCGRSTKAFPS